MTDQDPKGGSVQFENALHSNQSDRRSQVRSSASSDAPTISPISGTGRLKTLLDATSVTT